MAKFVMPVITILALFVWGFLILYSMHMVNRGGPLSECIEEGFTETRDESQDQDSLLDV